jgi:low affinity Fe/Cu permease
MECLMSNATRIFDKAAQWTAQQCGRPPIFALACGTVILWGMSGPIFKFSDTWQLVINTGTTIITFLMVFLIQNTQNRDTEALQIKLDELIRAVEPARNRLIDLEDLTEEEMDRIKADLVRLARKAKEDPDHLSIG